MTGSSEGGDCAPLPTAPAWPENVSRLFFLGKIEALRLPVSAPRPAVLVDQALVMVMRRAGGSDPSLVAMRTAGRCVTGPIVAVHKAVIVEIEAGRGVGHVESSGDLALS